VHLVRLRFWPRSAARPGWMLVIYLGNEASRDHSGLAARPGRRWLPAPAFGRAGRGNRPADVGGNRLPARLRRAGREDRLGCRPTRFHRFSPDSAVGFSTHGGLSTWKMLEGGVALTVEVDQGQPMRRRDGGNPPISEGGACRSATVVPAPPRARPPHRRTGSRRPPACRFTRPREGKAVPRHTRRRQIPLYCSSGRT